MQKINKFLKLYAGDEQLLRTHASLGGPTFAADVGGDADASDADVRDDSVAHPHPAQAHHKSGSQHGFGVLVRFADIFDSDLFIFRISFKFVYLNSLVSNRLVIFWYQDVCGTLIVCNWKLIKSFNNFNEISLVLTFLKLNLRHAIWFFKSGLFFRFSQISVLHFSRLVIIS